MSDATELAHETHTGLTTRQKENLWRGIIFGVLALLGVIFFVPFYWMIVQATHTSGDPPASAAALVRRQGTPELRRAARDHPVLAKLSQ